MRPLDDTAGIQPSGQPLSVLGDLEPIRGRRRLRPLGHEAYHGLVQDRMADVDAIARRRAEPVPLVPGSQMVVALDVDGTIVDMGGRVSERVMASIARLRAHEVQVVIATGRSIEAAMPVARHIGLTSGWMVCANGALTLRLDPEAPGGHEIVDSITFDPAAAIDTLRAAVPDGIVAVETPGAGFRVSRPFPDGELIEDQTVVSLEELRAQSATRVVLRAPGMAVDEFSALVHDAGLHSVEYAIGWTAWLDVAPQGVTKASALEALAARLGTDAAHAVAVGDGSNDVEMLQWAGVGVAMGSAPQWVRECADVVTEPVWRDGCAAVLDALIERTRESQ
ncbi:HAD family hydrolase [Actinomyces oricola]